MHRFFISPDCINNTNNTAIIDKEQSKHIDKVLRIKKGEKILCFDGLGKEYIVKLIDKTNGCFIGEIINAEISNNDPKLDLRLIQGIAKGEKMDTIIQKAVEIGVSSFYPVITDYTVVKLDESKAQNRIQRWQSIAIEACKQSRRSVVPPINRVIKLYDLLHDIKSENIIMLYENEKTISLNDILKNNKNKYKEKPLYILIGPEGGFSEKETKMALEQGAVLAGLGKRILRTETAAIVALGATMYEFGELD
ncbi:16S rRNA (uracil(1498)-N(3))-methyltransferase [Candidatus Syntrophocurvum alkaliphilum]|uniref:Ribosomal RNA small subunit methyltransferase E n=1 Tax=Candidatus Syntrophocurvum alkaliphilum TaxID=2293317 RepID=A0A6I6DJX6_9FIRM|nr:16S rRNA (uracil(1498)-N(3))-methyltransferase [Candidatus Syntrophocurvum alkaliphilum]QGT99994.1 16S rRNA (uracil(1498)-N(3))-methyltransferase [Candidatus Syntrophocurvum alkaliphilum]